MALRPDSPTWRHGLAARRREYRYLDHQKGVCGALRITLIGGTNLSVATGDTGRVAWRQASPMVNIKVGNEEKRSSVAPRNHSPSWNERFILRITKGSFQEGSPIPVTFEVVDAGWDITRKKLIGHGSLDVLSLLNGTHGSHVISAQVGLNGLGPDSFLTVVVEYEPFGLTPQVGDVVFFEAFARSPKSLVFPHNEPMTVKAISGVYLLVALRTQSSLEGTWLLLQQDVPEIRLKVHRNTVFVIERLTMVDSAFHTALDIKDAVETLPPVKWTKEQLQPYMKYISALARPTLTTLHIAFGAARLAAQTGTAALSGAAHAFLGVEDDRSSPFLDAD